MTRTGLKYAVPVVILIGLGITVAMAQSAPSHDNGDRVVTPMTLQQAVAAAVSTNPSLRSARNRVRRAAANIEAARGSFWPDVSVGINSQAAGNLFGGEYDGTTHTAQLSVSQMLYDFGHTESVVDRAQRKKDLAQAKIQKAYARVVRKTANAWLQVRKYKALARVAKRQLEALQELAARAQHREALGASTHSDTAQAIARVIAAQAQLLRMRSQVQRWRNTLMHWVGTPMLPRIVENDRLSALRAACGRIDTSKAPRQAASVQVARAKVAVARARVDVINTRLYPTLSLNVNVNHPLDGGGPRNTGTETVATLDFSMPLFQGGSIRANRSAAVYRVQAARAALKQAKLAATRHLQSAITQWHRYRRLRRVQQQRAHSMHVTLKLYRRQFLKLGTRSLLDLLNAEQEYYGVLSDLRKTRYHLVHSGLSCLYHAGHLDDAFQSDTADAGTVESVSLPGGMPDSGDFDTFDNFDSLGNLDSFDTVAFSNTGVSETPLDTGGSEYLGVVSMPGKLRMAGARGRVVYAAEDWRSGSYDVVPAYGLEGMP